jgi:hypothetical protein
MSQILGFESTEERQICENLLREALLPVQLLQGMVQSSGRSPLLLQSLTLVSHTLTALLGILVLEQTQDIQSELDHQLRRTLLPKTPTPGPGPSDS